MKSIENKSVELFWGYLYPFCSTFINHSGPMLSTNTNTSMNDIDDIDDINNKNVFVTHSVNDTNDINDIHDISKPPKLSIKMRI